jgi:AraC-like DNA-binding protein
MKIEADFSLTDLESNKGVNVSLDPSDLKKVLGYLITNQIDFSIGYRVPMATPANQTDLKGQTPHKSKNVNKADVIDEIYEAYIENISSDPPPTDAEIAKKFGLKLSTMKDKFKSRFGKTFSQLYIEKKMEYAALLLCKGIKAVKVSLMIGYGETSAIKFNKMFQKHFGVTPKKYQLEHYGKIRRSNKSGTE